MSIVIVGAPGSGKTVLLTVMAMREYNCCGTALSLTPENQEALAFVKQNGGCLNEGSWPPPNPAPGKPLLWTLRCGEEETELITQDFPGEVWQDFADKYDPLSKNFTEKTAVGDIEKILKNASGVLVVYDLSVNVNDRYSEQELIPTAIKNYQSNHKKSLNIALALTKIDLLGVQFGDHKQILRLLKEHAPFCYQKFKTDTIFPVAAVFKTDTDSQGRKIPAKNFSSKGIEEIMDWCFYRENRNYPEQFSKLQQSSTEKNTQNSKHGIVSCIERGVDYILRTVEILFIVFVLLMALAVIYNLKK